METSPTIAKLADALSKAQGEFESAKKDANNPFFNSKYADLASIFEAIRTTAAKHGLSVAQFPSINYERKTSIVTTILMHSSGEWIKDFLELPVAKFDAQGIGSAITYGRRYGLQSAYGIAAEEDDDGNRATHDKEPQAKSKPAPKPAKAEAKAEKESAKGPTETITGKIGSEIKQSDKGTWIKVGTHPVHLWDFDKHIRDNQITVGREIECEVMPKQGNNGPYFELVKVLAVVPLTQ